MNYFDYQNHKQTPIRVEAPERLSFDDLKTLDSLVAGSMLKDMQETTKEVDILELALEGDST